MEKKIIYIHNNLSREVDQEMSLAGIIAKKPEDLYWFNYELLDEFDWQRLLDALPLTDNEKNFFHDRKAFPRVEVVQTNGLYMRIPSPNRWEEPSHFIHLLLIGNVLVSAAKNETNTLDKAISQLDIGNSLEGREGIFLLMYLLENLEEHLINNYLEARSIINSFVASLGSVPEDQDNDKVVEIKGRLGNITGQCEEFLFACTLLRTIITVPYYPVSTKKMLNDILDTLTHVEHSMRKLDQRLEDQLHRIDSHLRELADKRLRILTVLSSIFLPLTFISSLYGMNFENMPEYGYEYAYPICLGVMLLIAVCMVGYFAVKGWFR